jgi:proteasome lid subunit RPN8/RPN11
MGTGGVSGHESEIVFGDIAYREPKRLARPDRDRALACLAVEVPRPDDLPIFLDLAPADFIERHALSDTSVELGGILLGREAIDTVTGEAFVHVTQALPARHFENTQASFTYTHESWAEITREREEKYPDLDIVGWYHTHPGFGIFLSGHDLFIHHHFFNQPLQIAYVVDPIQQTRGFFHWKDGQMGAVGGFLLTSPRAHRPELARFVHELERYPTAGPVAGGGGGADPALSLSPRLEAELIAMLRSPRVVAAPPRSSASPEGGVGLGSLLLGAVLGMAGLAGAVTLSGLADKIGAQEKALAAVQASIDASRDAVETARVSAKEKALDGLLSDVRIGATKETFVDAYTQMMRERDEARRSFEALSTDKEALNDLTSRLRAERMKIDSSVVAAQERAAAAEAALAELKKTHQDELNELGGRLEKAEALVAQKDAGTLDRKYSTAWFTAVAGVAGTLLMGLALVWSMLRFTPDGAQARG